MKVLKTTILRGPNYWSNFRKKLIVLKIDLESFAEKPTNQIKNFGNNLKKLIPTLSSHRCSYKNEGGFLKRVAEGTLLGHVVEHIALELQVLAGMNDCGFGRARETNQAGIYHVLFEYEIEEAGLRAGKMAIDIVETLVNGNLYQQLQQDIDELKEIYAAKRLGPSTEAIITEAMRRNIPVNPLANNVIMLGYGCNQKIFSATMTHKTSCIGADIVADKHATKELLTSQYLPTPEGYIIYSADELLEKLAILKFPVVIKPRFGNHGRGISTNVTSEEEALVAFEHAKKVANAIVVERFVDGFDFRFLLINYKLVAAAKRIPPMVAGDDVKTIQQLIDELNLDPNRGHQHENILTKIKIDDATLMLLQKKGLSLNTVLPANEVLFLKNTANISTGGTAIDVTDDVHPDNIFLVERVARLVNLDVCGIDLIAKDISQPFTRENSAILEVNAAPGFRMHLSPTLGKTRNVAKPFIEMLYPHNTPTRIPIVAVTGTNGKTTVVRLIAHIANQVVGKNVGMSTTDGIYIQNRLVYEGDCSGPRSAVDVLRDPIVNFAVLECARGGILRGGLGFDYCSTSIVTNVSADHLGQDDIHTLEELARVKSVVPRSTLKDGYAILNADDSIVYDMHKDLDCNIALFALNRSDIINQHFRQGNLVCFIEKDEIYIGVDNELIKVTNVSLIPLTLKGMADNMKCNILPAVLACWVNGIELKNIVQGLMNFYPTPENLPGRFNIFHFNDYEIMLDYAHNEKAYVFLKKYMAHSQAKRKIGIIAGTGDRKSEDIWKTGYYAGQIFDEIIIRHDEDSRGRSNDEITYLILQGIKTANTAAEIKIISDEMEAINYAIKHATKGTFIYYFPEHVLAAADFIKKKYISSHEYYAELEAEYAA